MQVENITWVPATQNETQNCQRLRDALASLPSAPRQLVRLAPGVFDCGSTTLSVPTQVTLEGSGDDTVIEGDLDHSSLGVVHLFGQAKLTRLQVVNDPFLGSNTAIAISAWDILPIHGSPTLVDVTAYVTPEFAPLETYSLRVSQESIRVEGGSFSGGPVRLVGSGYSVTFLRSGLVHVDADANITVRCPFYLWLVTGAPGLGPGCP